MPWATVNAESENTRNSAGNRIRMTDSGQSRKEAAVMTTGAVSAKTTTLIGFWNVRTMYEQGRMAQVIAEKNETILGNPAPVIRVATKKNEWQNRHDAIVAPILPLGFPRLPRLTAR